MIKTSVRCEEMQQQMSKCKCVPKLTNLFSACVCTSVDVDMFAVKVKDSQSKYTHTHPSVIFV